MTETRVYYGDIIPRAAVDAVRAHVTRLPLATVHMVFKDGVLVLLDCLETTDQWRRVRSVQARERDQRAEERRQGGEVYG